MCGFNLEAHLPETPEASFLGFERADGGPWGIWWLYSFLPCTVLGGYSLGARGRGLCPARQASRQMSPRLAARPFVCQRRREGLCVLTRKTEDSCIQQCLLKLVISSRLLR